MGHQDRHAGFAKHMLRHAAKNTFLPSPVAIGAHHQQCRAPHRTFFHQNPLSTLLPKPALSPFAFSIQPSRLNSRFDHRQKLFRCILSPQQSK